MLSCYQPFRPDNFFASQLYIYIYNVLAKSLSPTSITRMTNRGFLRDKLWTWDYFTEKGLWLSKQRANRLVPISGSGTVCTLQSIEEHRCGNPRYFLLKLWSWNLLNLWRAGYTPADRQISWGVLHPYWPSNQLGCTPAPLYSTCI